MKYAGRVCAPVVGDEAREQAIGPSGRDRPRRGPHERAGALFEVILCSGLPTQVALGSALRAAGWGPADGRIDVEFVVAVSMLDTIVLVFFLRAGHQKPRQLFFGRRPAAGEAAVGLPLAFLALALAAVVLIAIRQVAPWLSTVERNPLQELVTTPRDAALFAVVVVVAGGIREEVQRAFVLSRFEQSLGGPIVGVLVASVAFGAGHVIQGADAAIATGVLGVLWAVVYLRRRSIVAPVVSHAGFNLVQLAQLFASR
jgi:membrane protease YdiL (CAAX protease family)